MTAEVKNILLVGVGGQGTILASKILSEALVEAGYDVKMSEIHGMAQRGGNVSTQIRYGKDNVYSPIICKGEADILIAFEKSEAVRWLPYLKEGGKILINDYEIYSLPVIMGAAKYPEGALEEIEKVIGDKDRMTVFDANKASDELGNSKVQNLVILGHIVKSMDDEIQKLDWESIIKKYVPEKLADINIKAFYKGFNNQ